MDDYIDRTRLLALAQCDTAIIAPCEHTAEDIIDMIRASPAADVEPVRHGRWIEDGDFVVCPVCGRRWNVFDNDTDTFDRCPHCGAHIDGEVAEGV